MSTIYIEGWDDYGANGASLTAAEGCPWTTTGTVTLTNFPRTGSFALDFSNGSTSTLTSTFSLASVGASGCIGFGIYFNGIPNTTWALLSLYDSTSTLTNYLSINPSTGSFSINGGSTLFTAPFTTLTWYYIEYQFTLSTSGAGTATIWINGVQKYSGSALTNASHNANWQGKVVYSQPGLATYMNIDDLYFTTGNRLGVGGVYTYLPNANSATNTGWAASSGSAYTDVNAIPPGSNYIQDGTVGDISTFPTAGYPSSIGNTFTVMAKASMALDVAGSRGVALACRTHGANYVGATNTIAATSYASVYNVWDTNPNTGLQWTLADFNAAEFGVETTV